MGGLNFIPQLFFDVFARIIPGAVTIVLLSLATRKNLFARLFEWGLGASYKPEDSTVMLLLISLGASYVVGILLSPGGKLVQTKATKLFKYSNPLEEVSQEKDRYLPQFRAFLKKQLDQCTEDQVRNAIWLWYDWLRINFPEIGALTVKLRAEYTMYGSLAVAFALFVPVHLVSSVFQKKTLSLGGMLITTLCFLLSAERSAELMRTFQLSVVNFYFCGKEKVERGDAVSPLRSPRSSEREV